jgi:uncharacterized protein YjbI with pentapeptide repeats
MKKVFEIIWTWAKNNRTSAVLGLAVIELLLLCLVWRGFECWFDWFCHPFVGFRDFLKVIFKNSPLTAALFSAPIAYLIWAFRDHDKQEDIRNAKKQNEIKENELKQKDEQHHLDLDSKTFNQLQQWACDTSNPDLQVVAINQLCPYVLGEHGDRFKRPTFILLKTLWFSLVKEQVEKWDDQFNEWKKKFDSTTQISLSQNGWQNKQLQIGLIPSQKPINDWKNQLDQISSIPLAQAINYALVQKNGKVLRDHFKELPKACFAGLNFYLPNVDQPIDLSGLDMREIDLRGTDMRSALLQEADLSYAKLQNCILWRANLNLANLKYTNLSQANLREGNLEQTNLEGTNLQYSDITYARLEYANLYCSNLLYANINSVKLKHANLNSTNLQHANLTRSNLQNTTLVGSDLQHANLTDATLAHTDLESANLSHTDLSYTKIENTKLRGTRFDCTNFTQAYLQGTCVCPWPMPHPIQFSSSEGFPIFDLISRAWTFKRAGLHLSQEQETELQQWRQKTPLAEQAKQLAICLDMRGLNKNTTHEEIEKWLDPLWKVDDNCSAELLEALVNEVFTWVTERKTKQISF